MRAREWVDAIPSGLVPVVIAVIGALLIYSMGRANQSSSSELAEWKTSVALIVKQRATFDALRDSLGEVERRGREQARLDAVDVAVARDALDALTLADSVRRADNAALPVDSVAKALRLRPIEFNLWGTDSSGVRHLNGFRLEALAAREQMPVLRSENGALVSQLRNTEIALGAVTADRDTTIVRLVAVEALLDQGVRLADCRVLWVIPCPSRGVMFGLGVATMGAVAAATRE